MRSLALSNASTKYALVVREFQYNRDVSSANDINNYSYRIYNNTELTEEYKNKPATAFQMVKFKTGHCYANYSKWFNKETENIDYYTAHYQLHYEPHVITRNDGYLPRYDERFNEYGLNKIVHIKELHVADRHNFNVLNDGFIFITITYKVERFYTKTGENKNTRKRRQRTKGLRVQTSVNGCLDANVCVLRSFCIGSRQIYHLW